MPASPIAPRHRLPANPLTLHGASVFQELEAMQASGPDTGRRARCRHRETRGRALGLDSTGTVYRGRHSRPGRVWTPIHSATSATSAEIALVVRRGEVYTRHELGILGSFSLSTLPRGSVRMRFAARPIAACGLGLLLIGLAPASTDDPPAASRPHPPRLSANGRPSFPRDPVPRLATCVHAPSVGAPRITSARRTTRTTPNGCSPSSRASASTRR